MPIPAQKQVFELPDALAAKTRIEFYGARETLS